MDDEARESKSIKMKPSIVRKAHLKAIEQGKTLGRWIEDAIEEKIEREEKSKRLNRKDLRQQVFLGSENR